MMLLDIFQDLECTFGNTGKVWCKVYRYPRGIFFGWVDAPNLPKWDQVRNE